MKGVDQNPCSFDSLVHFHLEFDTALILSPRKSASTDSGSVAPVALNRLDCSIPGNRCVNWQRHSNRHSRVDYAKWRRDYPAIVTRFHNCVVNNRAAIGDIKSVKPDSSSQACLIATSQNNYGMSAEIDF